VGCGYGDFILWSGGAISPLDPMLYEHNMNFPNTAGYDEEILEDVSDKAYPISSFIHLINLAIICLTPYHHVCVATSRKLVIS
jgi:hypothetical protein